MRFEQFDIQTKILSHSEALEAYARGERLAPINVEIDLTNSCNHRCSFCRWADYLQETRASLPGDVVRRTLGELAALGSRAITWTGGGEPTLHREFFDLLDHSHQLGLENGLMTNGSLLPPEHDDQLLDQLLWIRVSMAGGTRDSYRAAQGADDFDVVAANLSRLAARKRARGGGAELGVAMLVKPKNVASVAPLVERLIAMGFDYLQLRPDMFAPRSELQWWLDEVAPVVAAAERRTAGTSVRVLGARYKEPELDAGFPQRCHAHAFVIAINAEGQVCFCKSTRDMPEFYLGDVREQSFEKIWREGLRVRELEESVRPIQCRAFCKNKDINRAVERRLRDAVEASDVPTVHHPNFL